MRIRKLRPLAPALVGLALVVPALSDAAAPAATTGQATNITSTGATLNGDVHPGKEATTYHFEYGTTTAYGTNTAETSAGSSNSSHPASAAISGLAASKTYHFRIVATNPSGTTPGQDMTFKTAPTGTEPGGPVTLTATPGAVIFGRATTLAGTVTTKKNAGVSVTLQQQPFPYTGAFADVGQATTDANGAFSFPGVAPQVNTRYRAVAKSKPTATSATLEVKVRLAVTRRVSDATVRSGQVVRFSGNAAPAHVGKLVRIQRRTRTGKFRTVAKTLTRAAAGNRSKYRKRVRIKRSGVYRVRVYPADGDHARGTSAQKRIRVVH